MARRVCVVFAALLAGLLVCPTRAQADCHDGRGLAAIQSKRLARSECRSFVLVDYTEAWGDAGRSADDLLTPDAEVVVEESPVQRYRGAEARRKFTADQTAFRGTYYTAVVTSGSHVTLQPHDDHGDDVQNLARVSWTGVVRCREAGCGKDITETVTAILVRNPAIPEKDRRPKWRIVSASITRRKIEPPPTPGASPKT